MFSNISIRSRLLVGFGLLIVFLIVSNVFGVIRMREIMTDMHEITEDRMPKISMANSALQQILSMESSMRAFFIYTTPEEHAALEKSIATDRAETTELLNKLKSSLYTASAVAMMDKIIQQRTELGTVYVKFQKALDEDPDKARKILLDEFGPRMQELIKSFAAMVEIQEGFALQKSKDAEVSYNENLNVSIGVLVSVLLIASLFSLWLIRSITRPLNEIQSIVTKVRTSNDFTHLVPVYAKDEVGRTAIAFNELMETLRKTLASLQGSVSDVDSAAESLVIASKESAKASDLTSSAASSMAASVEEMSVSINHVSDNAKSASELAHKAGTFSEEGGEVINNTVKEMQQIGGTIDHVSSVIGELGTQSDQISSIVQVIKEVADQTNLLALNAAIEAARAGEAGRGFAVVADEVRKLAERTSKATGDISTMIGNIQTSSQSAVQAMQQTVEQVRNGRSMAEQAGEAITQIRRAASDVVHVVKEIADSIAEQSSASQSIAQQLEQVAQAAEQNSSAADETSSSAHHLGDLAKAMHDQVEQFTI